MYVGQIDQSPIIDMIINSSPAIVNVMPPDAVISHNLEALIRNRTPWVCHDHHVASATRVAFMIVSVTREEKRTVGAMFVNGLDNVVVVVVVVVAGTFSKEALTSTGSGVGENARMLAEAHLLMIRSAHNTH
jgi:hypothetical protein